MDVTTAVYQQKHHDMTLQKEKVVVSNILCKFSIDMLKKKVYLLRLHIVRKKTTPTELHISKKHCDFDAPLVESDKSVNMVSNRAGNLFNNIKENS